MKLLYSASLTGLAAWMLSASARADEVTDIQSLLNEQVIVTATSTPQRESAAPALSTTITGEDIKMFGFRSIAQAVDFLSLGVFTGDTLRTPDIGTRGILFENDSGRHFLLLINGHAVNDPLYGAARFDVGAGIPIELVDRIEVVLGPGSVLYGSNAMMGVINVVTKSAADYSGIHATAEFEFDRSFRVGAGTGYQFKLFQVPSELTFGLEYYNQRGPSLNFPVLRFPAIPVPGGGDIPTVWGGRLNEGYFSQAPSGHLRLRVGDFEANLSANTYKRGIPYASSIYYVDFNEDRSWELDRAVRFDLRHQATITKLIQLTSRAYVDGFDYQRRLTSQAVLGCQTVSAELCQRYDAGFARWLGLEERLTLNWLHDNTLVTALGIDIREREVGAKQDQVDAATGRPISPTTGRLNRHGVSVGPYIQQTWTPFAWLDLNAGARLDFDDRFSSVLSPRGAVSLRPLEKTTFKAIYSQAFRAPTWSETSLSNHTVAPAPALLPERVRSIEGAVEQGLGAQRVQLGVFATRWTDLVETAAVPPEELSRVQGAVANNSVVLNIVQSANVASINNYGINGSWRGASLDNRLHYGANVTWAYARIQRRDTSALIAAAPQIFGNAHITYRFVDSYLPSVAFAIQAMGKRSADESAGNGRKLPAAPAFADFHLALTGRIPGLSVLGYVLSADYITATHGPYTAGPDYRAIPTVQSMISSLPDPGFAPIDQLRIMLGLRVDFLTGRTETIGESP